MVLRALPPFLRSRDIVSFLGVVEKFGGRPSEVIGVVDDEYTAYCFDEACLYILNMLNDNKKPMFDDDKEQQKSDIKNNYTCFSDLYKNYDD